MCVHGDEVQHCDSFMFLSLWTTMELYDTEEGDVSGIDKHAVLFHFIHPIFLIFCRLYNIMMSDVHIKMWPKCQIMK